MSLYRKIVDSLPEIGRLTSIPASWIDQAYLSQPKGFIKRAWRFMKIRAIYAGVFLPFALIDLLVSGAMAMGYSFSTFFTSDHQQDKRLNQQKVYATIFSKNFYALLSFLFGLISPKLVAFYFTPEKLDREGVSAGGSYYHDKNAELVKPLSIEDLQEVIRLAAQEGKKIIPIGAGLSQGKQFLPEGGEGSIVVDLSELNSIETNVNEKIVTVGAGARWFEIQNRINEHKLALQVMQASNVFSVGGSIGTNIHGWDHKNGSLANIIQSMTIINAQGELLEVTPDDELFHHITGGLGLFGIVVSVKLKLTDNEYLKERGVEVKPEDYIKHFREQVQTSEKTRMHLYRLSLDPNNLLGTGVSVNFDKEDDKPPVKTQDLSQESTRGTRYNQVMINLARRFGFIRKQYWEGEKARLLANADPELTTNEIMQPPINAMFNPSVSEAEWLQEFFLPEEQLAAFLQELGQLLMDNDVILLNASVRFVKQQQAPMSYAKNGDRFAVVLCFNQSLRPDDLVKAQKWLRQAQHLTVEKGGAYYLPYQHVSSPEDFERAYPHAKEAQIYKEEIDPQQVFTSGFHQKYMAPKAEKPNYFKAIMANDKTKKEFEGFLKVVLQRVDSDKLYALLEDILQYKDSHEEIYQELCRRLEEITPSVLADFRHILNSLSAIKEDLAAQAQAILPRNLRKIDGLVEIGYPGRFVEGFKKQYNVTGKIVAVYEGQSITDYVQTGFPRPYDQFEKLDYSQPDLSNLEANSADVITCYVGLHHFPEDKLDAFLADIKRVLRPGGHFLLVDHDVTDDNSLAMAHMAHMVFNAVNGTSLQDEMSELRNFQPMSYWQEKLAKHDLGFAIEGANVEMIRKGDPSRNRMISFVKKNPVLAVNNDLSAVNQDEAEPENDNGVINLPDWRSNRGEISLGRSQDALLASPPKVSLTENQDNKLEDDGLSAKY